MRYDFRNMKEKGTLNKRGWKTLPNGNSIPVDEPLFDFWFAYQVNSLEYMVKSQTIDKLQDAITIYTRHNDQFKQALTDSDLSITIDEQNYTVTIVQSDSSGLNGVDVITLQKTSD